MPCNSKSLKSKFDKSKFADDLKQLASNKLITEDEKNTLHLYLTIHKVDTTIVSKTYGDLLASAKVEDSLRKQAAALQSELNKSLEIKVLRKYFQNFVDEGVIKRYLLIDISIKNTTPTKIAGTVAHIDFKNTAGITFWSAQWNINESVGANSTITKSLSTGEYNNTCDGQTQLGLADIKKISSDYRITKLIYDDGTSKSIKY